MRITYPDKGMVATSRQAQYFSQQGQLILTGDVDVIDADGQSIQAERLTYQLDSERLLAEPPEGSRSGVVCGSNPARTAARTPGIPFSAMSLALERVSITLGGRPLVSEVSMELHPGEVVGLLGPNGAGKTTTFNMVTGLLRPDSGDVLLHGQSVTPLPMPQRARLGIGYLPQEASVFRNLSVRDNLRLALQESGATRTVHQERLEQLIEEFPSGALPAPQGFPAFRRGTSPL